MDITTVFGTVVGGSNPSRSAGKAGGGTRDDGSNPSGGTARAGGDITAGFEPAVGGSSPSESTKQKPAVGRLRVSLCVIYEQRFPILNLSPNTICERIHALPAYVLSYGYKQSVTKLAAYAGYLRGHQERV